MRNFNARRFLCTTTIIAGFAAMPAFAQTDTQPAASQETAADATKDIVVTGTLIRNPNLTASMPVNVVNDAEILKRAPSTVEELVRSLPGVSPSIGSQVNNGANGVNTIDLRGLGSQRNVVLLDGNRVVPTLANGATDLNVIPLALVQRVDVLTGGASTTYGADAVSGVVNFVTRQDFQGLDLRSTYKISEQGDGAAFRADMTLGANFADGRGNAVISFGYSDIKPVYQNRPFALLTVDSKSGRASGSSGTTVPTRIDVGGTSYQINPTGTSLVPYYQGYNFNPYNIFQTPLTRKSVYAATHYEVADGVEVYARGMFSQTVIQSIIAPSGIFGDPKTIPGNNPYLNSTIRDQLCTANGIALGATCDNNPAIPLPAVYRRLVELGPRVSTFENNVYDFRAGVRYDVSSSTKLDVGAAYGRSEQTQTQSGYVLNSRVQQALNATNTTSCIDTTNNCVPLNLFGPAGSITPAQVAFIQGQSTIRINTELTQLHALYSGDFGLTLPGASEPVNFALGAEYRKYTYQRIPDAFAQSPGELGGAGGAILPFTGGYDVKEVFGELIAPLVSDKPLFHELTLEAGARYSAYNIQAPGNPTFNTFTYKGGLTWAPTDDIRFRGNYQRAVRAPNINELFAPTSTNLTNLTTDPCQGTAPLGNPNLTAVCLAQGAPAPSIGVIPQPNSGQVNATFVTSTTLKPEKADTFTVGVVLTPKSVIPNFTLSVDYYNIIINNAITFATPGDAIDACFANITAASATSPACTVIRRNPANGGLSGSSATTPGLLLLETNLGRLATDGIDLTANYNRQFGDFGLDLNFVGNWTNHLRFQAAPSSVNRECVGYYSANCGPALGQIQPKLSWQQRTTVSLGEGSLSLLWRHIDPVRYEPGLPPLFNGVITNASGINYALAGQTVNFNRIPAYDYFDLTAQFEIEKRYQIVIGIQNLFNRQPPIVGGQAGSTTANSGNTFPSTYDPLGRSFSVSARVKF